MPFYTKKNIIFIAIFCFLIIFITFFYFLSQKNDKINFQSIQKNITKAQHEARQQNIILAKKIKKNGLVILQVKNFLQKYPYLVYRNKRLVFWSDAKYAFEYEQIQQTKENNYKESEYKELPQGKFLFEKKQWISEDDTIQLCSFIALVQTFNTKNPFLMPIYHTDLGISERITFFDAKISQNNPNKHIKNAKNETIAFFDEKILENNPNNAIKIQKISAEIRFWVLISVFLMLYLAMFWDWFRGIHQIPFLKQILRFVTPKKSMNNIIFVMIFTIFASCWAICYAIFLQYWVYADYKLDITREIDFSWKNAFVMGGFMAISLPFFYFWHKFVRVQYAFFKHNKNFFSFIKENLLYYIVCVVLWGILYFWIANSVYFWIISLHLLIFWVCQYTQIAKNIKKFNYLATIYLFLWAFFGGNVVTMLWLEARAKQNVQDMRNFANKILPEDDQLAEDFLGKVVSKLEKAPETQKYLQDTTRSYLSVAWQEKIRREYLGNYFNQYNVKILLFDKKGNPSLGSENTEGNFEYYQKTYQKIPFDTENPAIWHIEKAGANAQKRYLAFIDYPNGNHLLLDIVQKRQSDTYVFPKLLLSSTYTPPLSARFYSYAVYDNRQLVYGVGEFNYEKDFPSSLFEGDNIFLRGAVSQNYIHFALQGGFKKLILVTCPLHTWSEYFSLFSFWFLNLGLGIFIGLGIYAFLQNQQGNEIKFATRIQIYLNLAFFMPLLTISVVMWGTLQRDYKQEFERNFSQQTRQIARQLSNPLQDFQNKKIQKPQFTQILQDISEFAELDISVFDEQGRLLTTSQPTIYEQNILSKYINPEAIYLIKQEKNTEIVLPEHVGTLQYQSAYVPVKYPQNDRIQLGGVVSIPFFDAQTKLHQKLLHSFANILNIFVIVFLIFLILSYSASQILTAPLRQITLQIKKTSLYQENEYEELTWTAKTDEIGIFVQEYNKMLKKLESNKKKMAFNQKEDAWKEIARQVAHEINNPLTPMKLHLQMMQMRMNDQSEVVKRTFERGIIMLLEQIDVLNHIANSFSVYAKMPIAVEARFDVINMLKSTQELYKNNESISWNFLQEKRFFVLGDKELLGRIMVNLIKNAIEATQDVEQKNICITIKSEIEGVLLISVADNGAGIPLELQEKIFLPNFSTKEQGSGIGLALAKRGVEHASGRIWVESSTQKGTTFFVELPLVE